MLARRPKLDWWPTEAPGATDAVTYESWYDIDQWKIREVKQLSGDIGALVPGDKLTIPGLGVYIVSRVTDTHVMAYEKNTGRNQVFKVSSLLGHAPDDPQRNR